MSEQTKNTKFYGGIVTRVFVIRPEDSIIGCTDSTLQFIKLHFNTLRNYREFVKSYQVKAYETTSAKLPFMNSFIEGDACLLIGSGRFIDKKAYQFAKVCFARNIPVFFIRANSLERDSRVNNKSIWKTNSLIIKSGTSIHSYQAPDKYFMEIPSLEDIIMVAHSDTYYALLPAMVPVN